MIDFNPEDFFRKPEDVYAFNMQELDDYIALQEMKGNAQYVFLHYGKIQKGRQPIFHYYFDLNRRLCFFH
jgi:hypothetical protein